MCLKPDWVFISTPNDVVAGAASKAFQAGANVLVEKPFGRTLEECEQIIRLKPANLKLHVGLNYRFFAGVEAALYDAKMGKFGKLISVNMILGHGCAPGSEKSWKLDPIRCGNVVTDLGGHLFDLILQLSSGQIKMDYAKAWSGYWNTGIDEEAHMLLSDEAGTIFNAQVSLTKWRSTFKLEINGTEGYGVVDCRGRSYGPQSYKTRVRWGWLENKSQAESEIIVIDKNDCSDSFTKEIVSVLGLSEKITSYKSTSCPCDYQEARNIMVLINEFDNKKVLRN